MPSLGRVAEHIFSSLKMSVCERLKSLKVAIHCCLQTNQFPSIFAELATRPFLLTTCVHSPVSKEPYLIQASVLFFKSFGFSVDPIIPLLCNRPMQMTTCLGSLLRLCVVMMWKGIFLGHCCMQKVSPRLFMLSRLVRQPSPCTSDLPSGCRFIYVQRDLSGADKEFYLCEVYPMSNSYFFVVVHTFQAM